MDKPKKILFVEAATGGSHKSVTTAIIETLNNSPHNLQINRLPLTANHLTYQLSIRNFLAAYNLTYRATNYIQVQKLFSPIDKSLTYNTLYSQISSFNPDLILTNTFLGLTQINPIIKSFNRKIPFLIFVIDPFTPHALNYTPQASLTLVSSLAAFYQGIKHGIEPKKLSIVEFPVRECFFHTPSKLSQLKKKIGLNPSLPSIVLGGSGEGAEKSYHIIKHLIKLNLPACQLVILTANNTILANQVSEIRPPRHIHLHVKSTILNVADYVHTAEFVVAKAGPSIMFETLAAGKPFIASHHIHGQEDGNLAFIKCENLGIVEEIPSKTAQLIRLLLTNPHLYSQISTNVQNYQKRTPRGSHQVAEHILKHLNLVP